VLSAEEGFYAVAFVAHEYHVNENTQDLPALQGDGWFWEHGESGRSEIRKHRREKKENRLEKRRLLRYSNSSLRQPGRI
jgi:hypothetical protein